MLHLPMYARNIFQAWILNEQGYASELVSLLSLMEAQASQLEHLWQHN